VIKLVNVGEKAPNFTLIDTVMKLQNLNEFLKNGTILLAFFPFAFSPVCTKELCQYRDALANFEALEAQVVGISIDSPFALKAFAKENQLKFPLLSDFNKEVSKMYNVLHEEVLGLKGVSKRSVFIIDRNGIIKYRWISEDPSKEPDYKEIQNKLETLV
jgi:peroxiredoxin